MNMHKNARLTPLGRERLVGMIADGASVTQATAVRCVSAKTARKWYRRFQAEGQAGLRDRSPRPSNLRNPTPEAACQRIVALRRRA